MKILSTALKGAPRMGADYVGHPTFKESNPYGFFDIYESDEYASAFPNVRAIANEFMAIRPYAIDKNGKPVKHAAVDALYHPNQHDSSVSFFEKIAVSTLVNRKTYILVWRNDGGEAMPGGDFGRLGNNIAGYTFLENPAISIENGQVVYTKGSQRFTDKEVMVLSGGVDPKNLYGGYSPTIAAKKWATLDEYIADFQKGFFENNAIPAGQFVITAPTKQDFDDTVAKMKERHQGAGNNSAVTYTPRPIGADGKPADAKIEWIPFAQSNKDIDFKALFEQANHRLDLAFGVPAIIKGIDDAATYANAQVADKTFAKRAVKPLALRNYTQITHELNRLTKGTGIAITFDYDIPTVADEEKVEADTKSVEANIITTMTGAGYSLDSIVNAFKLSNAYKLLKKDNSVAVIDNDKPDVDEGNEVETSPDPDKIDGVTPVNKKIQNKQTEEEKLEKVALDLMKAQIETAKDNLDQPQQVATDAQLDTFVDKALNILKKLAITAGIAQREVGIELLLSLGLETDLIQEFSLKDDQIDRYRQYLRQVGLSYSEDTTATIHAVLDRANTEGLTSAQIKKELNKLPDLEGYRATRLARTETVKAGGNGSMYAMEQIQSETGYDIYKVWSVNNPDACDYCKAMDGKRVRVNQVFIPLGASIVTENGDVLVNDFVDIEVASAHPNDTCSMIYEVE